MTKIKNIFFDFGRTVVQHPADGAGLRIVKHFGKELSDSDAEIIRNEIFSASKYANRLDEGSMSREEYKKLLRSELPSELVETAILAADYPIDMLPFIEGMEELLIKLRKMGYKLFITSNMSPYHSAQMPNTVYSKYFDGMIFSGDIKVGKPAVEFYQAALEKFGVCPDETLFIDDIEENVKGAEALGIAGLVFRGNPSEALDFILKKG